MMLDLQGIKSINIENIDLKEEDYKLDWNDDLKTAVEAPASGCF